MKNKIYTLIAAILLCVVGFNATAQKSILFLGGAGSAVPGDQQLVDSVAEWGYEITYIDAAAFADAAYSDYDGLIISESISSSAADAFRDADFPIPCLNYEGYTARTGKWSWVEWEAGVNEDYWFSNKSPDDSGLTAVIVDNTHYITKIYDEGDEIVWSTAASPGEQVAIDFSEHIPEAIPLAANLTEIHDGKHIIWAIPEGTDVMGSADLVPIERMVVFPTHINSLAPAETAPGFFEISKRCLVWVLNDYEEEPEPTSVIKNNKPNEFQLVTNPVNDNAKFKFNLVKSGMVSMSVFSISGQKVEMLAEKYFNAGNNNITFNTSKLNSGLYLYEFHVNNTRYTGKMLIE